MQANMGMAGEFRCVVKRADGSTKIDTGYQKNLILNQGLDFFGGGHGGNMMNVCLIGSGNSQPNYTQNKLDAAIGYSVGSYVSSKYDYDTSRDGGLYKINRVDKYTFTGLDNANISELGLASTNNNTTTYFLCTRALIKDSQGNPTTITVLSGEVLEIYYKLWAVYDVTDKTGTLNLLDGIGGKIAYNYTVRLAKVGSSDWYASIVGLPFGQPTNVRSTLNTGDLTNITSMPSGSGSNYVLNGIDIYANNSYKQVNTLVVTTNNENKSIRSFTFATNMGSWQIRFGAVVDDSPITKTSTQSLTIPVEVSWGRYEGVL